MNRHTLMRQLVVEEATKLKNNISEEEKQKLSFQMLNHKSRVDCIYGQLTGNCDNDRARELMDKCCTRVYSTGDEWFVEVETCKINGNLTPKMRRELFFSPIEVFISQKRNQKNGNNELLVNYIKGEIDELVFG